MAWLPRNLRLLPDSSSRSKCIANDAFRQGSQILHTQAFATILLDKEKGSRCDACFRQQSEGSPLKRCSGCGSYWYCDSECQSFHWTLNHKRLCRGYNSYIASSEYQAMFPHERLDSILLSHTLARLSLLSAAYTPAVDSAGAILLSLLPHPPGGLSAPFICSIKPSPPSILIHNLYSCFGNNNFVVHSHLSSIGHGVFPIASRLFNHSCTPNAVVKYSQSSGTSIAMDVIALHDISPGEEICVPYLDPALLQTRKQMLQLSYGFECNCRSCKVTNALEQLPEIPSDPKEKESLAKQLRDFAGIDFDLRAPLPEPRMEDIPRALHCVLREDYMSSLSETFSKASHEGDYHLAVDAGLTLLALYLVVYPQNYPQTGVHLLEMTKTLWNARIFTTFSSEFEPTLTADRVATFLSLTREVLLVYGPEGDEGGPLQEVDVLENLLSSE